MGMTFLTLTIKKAPESRKSRRVKCLIDTGALYTVVPGQILQSLGIRPYRREEFTLADGSSIKRRVGMAYMQYKRTGGGAPVVFGEPGDSNLLGATTLEAMGMMIDPLSRELRRLPAMLAPMPPSLSGRGGM